MLNVVVENVNGVLVTTSNRVAEELEVNHRDLLEKIDNYVEKFRSGTFRNDLLEEFYISSFRKIRGRNYRNYLITKKGIAQLIGGYSSAVEKAFELNVAYINKFDEMEKLIYSQELLENSCQKKLSYDGYIPIHREKNEVEFKDWDLLKGSAECMNDISKMMNKYIENINDSMGRIEDLKTHIYFYSKQVTKMLEEFESRTLIIKN